VSEERKPTKFPQEAEVPKHQKKAQKRKPFGIEYFSNWFGGWTYRTWYPTTKARDQAFGDLDKKTDRGFRTTKVRKIDR
jgi:hypothetical protein